MGSSHHGDGPIESLPEGFIEHLLKTREKGMRQKAEQMTPEVQLGAQHDFPAGQYGPTDEGALRFAVGHDKTNGRVVMEFGSPVAFMAMEPDQARHLANLLLTHAGLISPTPGDLMRAIKSALHENK